MKRSVLILLVVFTSVFSSAQNVEVLMGDDYIPPKRSTLSGIIGSDNNGFYVLSNRGLFSSQLSIVHFDNALKKVNEKDIELETEGKERYLEFIKHSNDKIYLFSSFRNQKLKKKFLFMETVNKQTLTPDGNLKKIVEIEYDSKYNSGDFNLIQSMDKERLLLFYNLPYESGQPEKFAFTVMDKNMNVVWTKNVVLPYPDELFQISSYVVSNRGDVYLTAKLYKEKAKDSRGGNVNFEYVALCYFGDKTEPTKYSIALDNLYLTDIKVAVNNQNDIVCAGFYSETGTSSIKGAFYMLIDGETRQIKKKGKKEFTLEFITQEMTEREAARTQKRADKGKDIEMYQYSLDHLVTREDGGAVLVAEQYFTRTHTYTTTTANGHTSTRTTTKYYYNDILVININPTGEIEWATKVPKYQVSSDDGGFYSSYALGIDEDRLLFIFNDNPKNLLPHEEGKTSTFNAGMTSVVVCASVDNSGKVSVQELFKSTESGIVTRPKVSEQMNENSLLIFGQTRKLQRFALLKF